MNIKECFLASSNYEDFESSWIGTAEDRVFLDFNGSPIELTTLESNFREFSTGPSNRRAKRREAKRYKCLHILKHRGTYFVDYYDGERVTGRFCSRCYVNIW